jgi:hypothetical protein
MSTTTAAGRIDNRGLREAFERQRALGRVDSTLVAIRLGWESRGKPDTHRVNRALGISPDYTGRRGKSWKGIRRTVNLETAAALCEAIGLDPHEVDGL